MTKPPEDSDKLTSYIHGELPDERLNDRPIAEDLRLQQSQ